MNALGPYFFRYWKSVLFSLLFLACEAACDLMQPTILAHLVDRGIASRNLGLVLRLAGWMLMVTAAGAVAAVGRNIISSIASTGFGADLRAGLFRKIQTFSFESIDRFETGSLVTRLTNDVNQVQFFFHGLMRIFAKAPLMAAGSIVMAVMLNPRMSLVLLAVIPPVAAVIVLNLRLGFPLFTRVQEALDKVNTVIREYLGGVRVVKAFNRFDYERARFETANEGLAGATTRAMRVMASFWPGVSLSLNIGIIAVLWLGGMRVNRGSMQVGEIIAFINYMSHIMFSLMMISMVIAMFARARASGKRIGEVLAEKPAMAMAPHPRQLDASRPGVRFDRACLSHGAAPVLSGISISVAPGEAIGVIGSTGSGKTSLMHLLPRFYDVSSVSVSVAGVDVREADASDLRRIIAMVPQKTTLFTGTILENIRWGRPSASRDEAEQAAVIAQAHDFICALPQGYDTMLGQGGINLSGGQKQRIALARALVRLPRILILDDCTSSVDSATESRIRAGLAARLRGVTSFTITQRVMSVMGMHRIAVLENGAVAGLGAHAALMKECGVYREIFRSQVGPEAGQDG